MVSKPAGRAANRPGEAGHTKVCWTVPNEITLS